MKTQANKKQTRGQLPVQIRYRAQDYETRFLDDPRVLYIEEFHAEHADDGFVAIIPTEKAAKRNLGSKWTSLGRIAVVLASLSWIACQLSIS